MSYKIMQLDRPQSLFQRSVQLDRTRNTAILIRQSRRGSDKLHVESRMLQESLIPFVQDAREEEDLTHIHIFDEGSGVSGTKGIDKRHKLRDLHVEIASNVIGDIVLARPDRLFRDKHFANVATFTQLAERMRVKVIVPRERGVLVYDFTKYEDLKEFQRAMQEAYSYIDVQIGYMNRARAFKVGKGYYGGGNIILPYVLVRDMPKEQQIVVIYDPWREQALDLFTKFKEFNFQTGRVARYIDEKPYLFKFMELIEPLHAEQYQVVTTMTRVNGGYTIANMESLRRYLKNLTLAGFAKAGRDEEGNIILVPNILDAVVPLELFDPCFASLTGEHIDGTPFDRKRQYKGGASATVDAILHGLLTSDEGDIGVFANADTDYPIYDLRNYNKGGIGRTETLWSIPARPIDRIVLDRLIALAEYDNGLVERVRQFFAQAQTEGVNSLVVLDTAIKNTQEAIQRVGRTLVKITKGLVDERGNPLELPENDPLIVEKRNLHMQLYRLQKQRDDAARQSKEDPSNSITGFYHVLSHLTTEFHKLPPQTKKDFMRRLIEEVKIQAISPHLFTLHITWIRPLAYERDDVALLWRSTPTRGEEVNTWTPEEDELVKTLYPNASQFALMQALPYKTQGMMKNRACYLEVSRQGRMREDERFSRTVMYADLEAAAQFAKTDKRKRLLWYEINELSQLAKKGRETNITALWFFSVDMVSFVQSFNVTDVIKEGLSGQGKQAT
jgi:hypothetical protein